MIIKLHAFSVNDLLIWAFNYEINSCLLNYSLVIPRFKINKSKFLTEGNKITPIGKLLSKSRSIK